MEAAKGTGDKFRGKGILEEEQCQASQSLEFSDHPYPGPLDSPGLLLTGSPSQET